jgi:hypothetical protein
MGHVSPGSRQHGNHSGPQCTALLSLCINYPKMRVEGCIVSTILLLLPIIFCPFKWASPVHLHRTQKNESQCLVASNWGLVIFLFSLFSFLLFSSFFCNHVCTAILQFLQIEDTTTHSWSSNLLICVQLADTFLVLQLACLAIFRQKPEFQGVQDIIQAGMEPIPTFLILLLKLLITCVTSGQCSTLNHGNCL